MSTLALKGLPRSKDFSSKINFKEKVNIFSEFLHSKLFFNAFLYSWKMLWFGNHQFVWVSCHDLTLENILELPWNLYVLLMFTIASPLLKMKHYSSDSKAIKGIPLYYGERQKSFQIHLDEVIPFKVQCNRYYIFFRWIYWGNIVSLKWLMNVNTWLHLQYIMGDSNCELWLSL